MSTTTIKTSNITDGSVTAVKLSSTAITDKLGYTPLSNVGNAATASKLYTARTIALGGDVSGSVLFDGSQDVTINVDIGDDSVALGTNTTGNYVKSITAPLGTLSLIGSGEGADVTIDLPNTGVNPTTYGSSSHIPSFTVDAQGRLTAASEISLTQLSSGLATIDYIDIDTTYTATPTTGRISWNTIDGTLDIGLQNGVNLQLGQETNFYAKATEVISNGQLVMFAGAQGDHLLIAKADLISAGFKDEYIVGVATQDFATNQFGYVTTFGKVRELNTSAWAEGTLLYADPATPGALTATRPIAPNHAILVATVVSQHATQGTLLVRPTFGSHLNELHDVNFTSVADNNIIQYDSSSGVWENVAGTTTNIAEGTNLYYTDARVGSYLSTNSYATQSYVNAAVANLVDSAPTTLDTLNELAAALGDDANYATTISTALGAKLNTLDFNSTFDTRLATKSTSNLSEGTNLYYTTSRANSDFDARLQLKTTTDLAEGTNLYYTDARVGSYLTSNSYATESYVTSSLANYVSSSSYTASDVLAKIQTVDGTGSGLDADTIRGYSPSFSNTASALVLRDASGNFSAGTITAALSGNASTATTSQYISIGSTGSFSGQIPFAYSTGTNGQLLVDSDGGFTYDTSSNTMSVQTVSATTVNATNISATTGVAGGTGSFTKVGVGTSVPTNNGDIRAAGEITAYYSSDENLKENIVVIDNALEKLRTLSGVFFDWKDEVIASRGGEDGYFVRKHDTGLIAQQVEKVLPEVVGTREDGSLAVKYEKMAGLIVQAINELADRLDSLEKKVG